MATTQLPHSSGDPVGHDRLCASWGQGTNQFPLALLVASCPRDKLSSHWGMHMALEGRLRWSPTAARWSCCGLGLEGGFAPGGGEGTPDPWAPLPFTLLPEAAEG